jgi:ferritin-like metal-binding protein YciE
VCDAALIVAAQRVEHHEIAAYGTVRGFARRLGYENQAQLFDDTLQEEGETDKKLTSLAKSNIREKRGRLNRRNHRSFQARRIKDYV